MYQLLTNPILLLTNNRNIFYVTDELFMPVGIMINY